MCGARILRALHTPHHAHCTRARQYARHVVGCGGKCDRLPCPCESEAGGRKGGGGAP